jgi:hypothetical protein
MTHTYLVAGQQGPDECHVQWIAGSAIDQAGADRKIEELNAIAQAFGPVLSTSGRLELRRSLINAGDTNIPYLDQTGVIYRCVVVKQFDD